MRFKGFRNPLLCLLLVCLVGWMLAGRKVVPFVDRSGPLSEARPESAPEVQGGSSGASSSTLDLSAVERSFASLFDTPIRFYGRVVDEKGAPIAGAKVRLQPIDNPSTADPTFNPEARSSVFNVETDGRGECSRPMRGVYLAAQASKEGYYSVSDEADAFFTHDAPDPHSKWRAMPKEAAHPAIFILRRKGQVAKLIHLSYVRTRLVQDGTPVEVSLATGKQTPVGQGDIMLELRAWPSGAPKHVYAQYDWRCRISVPGGGLQIRKDDMNFTAPSEGYQGEELIQMDKNAPRKQWEPDEVRHYFIRTQEGKYARVDLRIMASVSGGGGELSIEDSYLNPDGSTNLESGMQTGMPFTERGK